MNTFCYGSVGVEVSWTHSVIAVWSGGLLDTVCYCSVGRRSVRQSVIAVWGGGLLDTVCYCSVGRRSVRHILLMQRQAEVC